MSTYRRKTANPLTLGLALVAGTGLILIMFALGMGVIVADVDGGLVGGLFALGLVLLIFGVGAWLIAVQPHKQFDDIDIPLDTGHHGAEPHEEHALALAEPTAIEPHAESHS